MFELLSENGYTASRVKQENIISQGTYYGLKNGTAGIDARTINKLCALLNCQPGDLMEYVPDEE
ncbi:MAG: helix-turn-helix transcriptional regulator [Oscillospiraceae bacterium]|nr:helix-turn-helix transcriptional regulator [Oscillospiraceae bacterium]